MNTTSNTCSPLRLVGGGNVPINVASSIEVERKGLLFRYRWLIESGSATGSPEKLQLLASNIVKLVVFRAGSVPERAVLPCKSMLRRLNIWFNAMGSVPLSRDELMISIQVSFVNNPAEEGSVPLRRGFVLSRSDSKLDNFPRFGIVPLSFGKLHRCRC